MKSLDDRYDNQYDDVYKHWVDNIEDYDDENLFFTRLKLLEDSKLYFPFLESCMNPTYITDEEYRQHLVKVISFIGMIVEDKGDYYDLFVDKKIL